jgi:hypothetical protein
MCILILLFLYLYLILSLILLLFSSCHFHTLIITGNQGRRHAGQEEEQEADSQPNPRQGGRRGSSKAERRRGAKASC